MSRVWIPTIGDHIRLTRQWSFPVTREYRNGDLLHLVDPGGSQWGGRNDPPAGVFTMPEDTVLKVERIYIRGTNKGFRQYDSVTFRVVRCPRRRELTSKKNGGTGPVATRFFAKLSDVNEIEAEPFDAQRP